MNSVEMSVNSQQSSSEKLCSGVLNSGKPCTVRVKGKIDLCKRHCWQGEACSICLEPLGQRKGVTKTICNHYFHTYCLKQITNDSCPLCREELELTQIRSNFAIKYKKFHNYSKFFLQDEMMISVMTLNSDHLEDGSECLEDTLLHINFLGGCLVILQTLLAKSKESKQRSIVAFIRKETPTTLYEFFERIFIRYAFEQQVMRSA